MLGDSLDRADGEANSIMRKVWVVSFRVKPESRQSSAYSSASVIISEKDFVKFYEKFSVSLDTMIGVK